MVQVKAIKAFSDNYIWCISNEAEQTAWVVDPGQAEPVLNYLYEQNLTLCGILITHHHYDHTDGVAALVKAFRDIPVYGPRHSPFKGITHGVSEADKVTVYDYTFTVLATPGHTLDHVCYINDELSFTGDTLFSAGCGRLFEGSAEQMWHSLCKLRALPDECKIYCTHEYTQANLDAILYYAVFFPVVEIISAGFSFTEISTLSNFNSSNTEISKNLPFRFLFES